MADEEYDCGDDERSNDDAVGLQDAMWVQDDLGYWYEWSYDQHYACYDDSSEVTGGSDSFLLEDAVHKWMAEDVPSTNHWSR